MYTGWTLADPLIGAGIGLFIVPRTWRLLSQTVHILMEGVPIEIDVPELEKALLETPGIIAVHDLHVWTITSGTGSLIGHLVVRDMKDAAAVLKRARSSWTKNSRSIT